MHLDPIIGLLLGILMIVFRVKIAHLLEKGINKSPIYDRSVFDLTVKPINVVWIGAIFIFANFYFLLAQIL